ncbi:cell wall-binding repeat-containing protein [Anaerobacillus sp. CMMVII]|uniref:cell wall-binding repeat-containing protein n=1 Tax=Anaerobacillus sp. CMMVII TaxID=2755588 RepID=UPI0021B7F5EB|nr:cell wall-binding repeat-containing protein [Anaerobacillus sp. CMMVII]MCT8137653.1 cell wall-binding repeat-containing protein [Anaerobacillus sp. CMMVII]
MIFTNQPTHEVQHRTNGTLQSFYNLEDAINFAKSRKNTRIISLDTKWTVWSNFLTKKYDLIINNNMIDSFYDYNLAHNEAKSKTNARIVNNLTGDVLWTNQTNSKVTRNLSTVKLSGQTRYITAVEISKTLYPNGFPEEKDQKVVILATGQDAADGLSAGPLATVYGNAPILLTRTNELTEATKNEILRLQAKKVIILGGHLAIEEIVEEQIIELGLETERISGRTRYDTNRLILERLGNLSGVFVTSGRSFADAIAAAPIAAANNWGIVLSPKNDFPTESLPILNDKDVIMLGGQLVMSDKVETTITNYKQKKSAVRYAGKTRYDTLSLLLNHFRKEVNSNQIILTTGTNFPDALASAPLAIHSKAPLILVGNSLSPALELFLMEYAEKNVVEDVIVIGGIVKDPAINQIRNAIR